MEGFRRSESWKSSDATAPESLTRARTPRSAHQEQIPSLNLPLWNGQLRSIVYKSMEASLVNQLNDSVDFLGWDYQKEKFPGSKLSRQTRCSTSSGQFKVLQGGCWKKINFERPGFQLNKTDQSSCFMASPWIQHFRFRYKSCVLASCSLQDNASSKEVSDQNFVDEEQGEKTSIECSSKKLRTLSINASCNDQVKLPLPEVAKYVSQLLDTVSKAGGNSIDINFW